MEVMCVSVSFCVDVPPGNGLWSQNVAGRQSGRVTEHIKTHTHSHTRAHTLVCLLAWRQAHRKCPCGCQPPPIVWHTGEEWEEGEGRRRGTARGVGGEVGTQKSKIKKMESQICSQGWHRRNSEGM